MSFFCFSGRILPIAIALLTVAKAASVDQVDRVFYVQIECCRGRLQPVSIEEPDEDVEWGLSVVIGGGIFKEKPFGTRA